MTRTLPLLLLLSLGCASLPTRETPVPTTPGAKLVATAEHVAQQYGCAKRKRPHFVLEESTATPTPIVAGTELDHRLAYALCPARVDQAVAGKLRTRILYEGKAVVDDSADYQLLPGRIVVDTLIGLPPTAPPGGYELEVSFIGAGVRFSTQLPFAVKP